MAGSSRSAATTPPHGARTCTTSTPASRPVPRPPPSRYTPAMRPSTVVFVEPPYVCWDRRRDRVREGEEEIPGIGTLTLAAVVRERGHRAHIVDGKRTGTPVEQVARQVAALAPDHVGISATTISIHNAARIAARVKALVPDFPLRFQPNVFNYRATPVASVVTSRGCPFSCTFCDRSTSGRRGRFHGVDYVVEMCRRLERLGVRHVLFYDDLFTVSRRRVVELCERFLAEGFRFTWSCNSHPNLLDAEHLRLMRRAGCWQIAYGIEAASQRVRDVVVHEVKIPRLLETLRQTRAAGIRVKGLLM